MTAIVIEVDSTQSLPLKRFHAKPIGFMQGCISNYHSRVEQQTTHVLPVEGGVPTEFHVLISPVQVPLEKSHKSPYLARHQRQH